MFLLTSLNNYFLLSDLLETKVHTPSAAPVQVRKDGGDWYGHKGTDVKDTHQRKGSAVSKNPHQVALW